MKTIIFIFLTLPFMLFSQQDNFICGTPDNNDPDPNGVYSHSIDPTYLSNYEIIVYNIFFWGINNDDGTSENILTENEVLGAVASLNIAYNKFNIFFKYRGFDFINNSDYYISPGYTGSNSIFTYAEDNGFVHEKSFNVYVPYLFTAGYSGIGRRNRTSFGLNSFSLNSGKIEHEIGHNFNLHHTFYGCEHVTRNEDDPLYDADYAGDAIPDTAAMPSFHPSQGYPYINTGDCSYEGNETNCHSEEYIIEPIGVKNFMGYTHWNCRENLTPGQGIRIREAIEDDIYEQFEDAKTDIKELYKPYKGEYYLAGPVLPEHKPLFQPGFNYHFVECSGNYPQPADFDETFSYNINNVLLDIEKEEIDYNTIIHPNHTAIHILHHDLVPIPYPRKCYNNWNLSPIGGTLVIFNDNVLNNNVTIIPQDSTAINNPNLIQNLENGLYQIEKNYNDGSTQETVILKENN